MNLELESAQRTILVVMGGSALLTLTARVVAAPSERIAKDGSVVRIVVGTVGGSLILMTVATFQPDLAKLFGFLVLMGTVYTYGPVMLARFRKTVKGDFRVVTEQDWKKANAKRSADKLKGSKNVS
jgi:Cu/Ag efflux pump CusA